jgi:heme/copper-type cytochrome/quinol oxidase subunit 1
MPMFCWTSLASCLLIVAAFPILTATFAMLLLDRYLGFHFFTGDFGGNQMMYVNRIWAWGHPEVYILVLPAFAFANEIIPVFSRKAIFGYPAMVAASVGIGFVSLSVWAHHMFTVGMGAGANAFFTFSTMVISVPTGIKIFNWLATLWGGNIHFTTSMKFAIGFLFQFLVAGLTGIMLAVSPFDWQLGSSYFIVAHFHYVLVGAILMMIFSAFYYWYPKMTGRMLSEKLGSWHFWLFVIGFHLTFDFMHIPGILGMPRRIYTYEADRGWALLNQIVSSGAVFQAVATLIFVWNMVASYFKGEKAGPDPWDAWTLEWTTSSPPPSYNFAVLPTVESRRPLWDRKHPEEPDAQYE